MRNSLLAVIFSLFCWSRGILADDDIKRGTFPFMGFLYYQDESVQDDTGARFLQGAVLIRQNFLISSTLVSSISDDPLSKTLLARLGAIRIDTNFTVYEDEDEQEQEIVQITRPISNRTWWATDISLLKTLLPFKTTSAVHVTQLSVRQDYSDKTCNIIIFKKRSTSSDGNRFLTRLSVEMLPSTTANCGEQFEKETMACAVDPQSSSSEERSPANFCQGNSGGPLICDNDVMALQTYIKGNCNPPHLYQLLAPWKKFLACGTEDICTDQDKCPNVCSTILKDPPTTAATTVQSTTVSTTIATTDMTKTTESTEQTMVSTPETRKQNEPSESSDSKEESEESTEAAVAESTEAEKQASVETTDIKVIVVNISNTSESIPMNDSKSTPWPALKEGRLQKAQNKKVSKTKIKRLTAPEDDIIASSTNRHAITLHGLIFNCLVACICFM